MLRFLAGVSIVLAVASIADTVSWDCSKRAVLPDDVKVALNKCVQCHAAGKAGPSTVADADQALCRRSPILIEKMMGYARARPTMGLTEEEANALRRRYNAFHQAEVEESPVAPRIRLVSAKTDKQLNDLLPVGDTSDPGGRFFESLKRRGIVFYDTDVIPTVLQAQPVDQDMTLQDPIRINYPRKDTISGNTYADRGALEFPWRHGAGLDYAPSMSSFKFFVPPVDGPMVETFRVSRDHAEMYSELANELDRLYGYTFLPGTVFGEVLTVRNGQAGELAIEVRLRHVQADGTWFFDVLRPFPTRDALTAAIKTLFPMSSTNPQLQALVRELEKPTATSVDLFTKIPKFQLKINSEASRVLERHVAVQTLPELEVSIVEKLVTATPFRSSFGAEWVSAEDGDGVTAGFFPESQSAFHLAPKGYLASHLKLNSAQCVKCHANSQYAVKRFDPPKGTIGTTDNSNREWYGHMHGSTPQKSTYGLTRSGIFSFHPFNAERLATTINEYFPVQLDKRLVDAKLIRQTNEDR